MKAESWSNPRSQSLPLILRPYDLCPQMFVVVGAAVSQAVALQKVACKALGVPVLVTEAVARQVSSCS